MRLLKIMLITIVIGGVSLLSLNCTAASDTAPQYRTVAVQRGNLSLDITGVGNLALSYKENLAFAIAGTVAEVLVEEGDTVAQGQVLAKLDTSEWDKQLSALGDKITVAERQLTAKKRALTAAERQLGVKKRNVTAKERDVLQAEINLKNAQTTLEKAQVTYTVADFTAAQAEVDAAKANLDKAMLDLPKYDPGTEGYKIKQNLVVQAQSKLNSAQAKLEAILSGFDTEDIAIKKQQVGLAQGKLEEARATVNDALIAVEDAQKDIEDAQFAVKDAQKALADAQQALADAQKDRPQIIAPSAGFIIKVNIAGGDEVKKGAVAVTLADPNKFEADILVNEMDILQTRLGGNASVQVAAIPGMSLLAKVTHIAPTAVIQQGVVNYKVKVTIESLQSVMLERQQATGNLSADNITAPRQPAGGTAFSGNVTSSGAIPERFRQAIEEGGLTQEQIAKMRRQRQAGQQQPPAPVPTMLLRDFQLREGQTVTVSILVAERHDVLLVPNSAITRQGMESMVKVLKEGVIEERSITAGISNWQYTEVTGGLREGEQVVLPQTTTSSPTRQTPPPVFPGGRMFR